MHNKFYTDHVHKTQEFYGFYSKDEIAKIRNEFFDRFLNPIRDRFFDEQFDSIPHIENMCYLDGFKTVFSKIIVNDKSRLFKVKGKEAFFEDFHKKTKETIDYDITPLDNWCIEQGKEIQRRMEQKGYEDFEVNNVQVMNSTAPIPVHADGIDLLDYYDMSEEALTDEKRYLPLFPKETFVQGIVGLDVENVPGHGPVVFDQLYPYRAHWYTWNHDAHTDGFFKQWKEKRAIMFTPDDEPFRFGEAVRNYTHKPLPDEDFQILSQFDPDATTITKDGCFGLSLERLLPFEENGKMLVWDNKKLHAPLPFQRPLKDMRLAMTFFSERKSYVINGVPGFTREDYAREVYNNEFS